MMAGPIAFCENPSCGAVFQLDRLIGGIGNVNINFKNSRAGPCPACGGKGLIPDGTYEYANGVLGILASSKVNISELQKVEKILRVARQAKNKNSEEIIGKVKKASPAIANAFDSIPKQSNILQWLAILISLVALAIQVHSTYFKETPQSVEKKVIEYLLKEFGVQPGSKKNSSENRTYRRKGTKIQRNDPCPCGSGKKFKKCCGNPLKCV